MIELKGHQQSQELVVKIEKFGRLPLIFNVLSVVPRGALEGRPTETA